MNILTLAKLVEHNFEITPHIVYLYKRILPALIAGNARFVIAMPPRHGKSTALARILPTWYMLTHPRASVVIATNEQELANAHGLAIRDYLMQLESILGVKLVDPARHAMHALRTTTGATLRCLTIRGSLIGHGADLAIVDDPYRNFAEAVSPRIRQQVSTWFRSTLYSRLQGKRNIIVIQQRLHAKDLAGELMQRSGWTPIILPALACENDPLGRQPGEPLWATRFGRDVLEEIRTEIGDALFNALYQQRPITEEGNLFHSRFFEMRYDTLPELSLRLISIDTAQTASDKADYTAWTVWGYDGHYVYLLDCERHRVEYPALLNITRRLIEQHRAHYVLIEQSASGYALLQTLRTDLQGAALVGVPPIGSKIVRALTASTWFEQARVLLPAQLTPQMHAWLAEMLEFPNSPHDDFVDSTTLALNWLRNVSIQGTWRIVR